MPFWLPAAIGAIGTIGATAISQSAANRRQRETNETNVELTREQREHDIERYDVERADSIKDLEQAHIRLRESAEKGGFNPLTVVGGSGGALSSAMLPASVRTQPGQVIAAQAPPLASTAGIGDALMGVAEAFQDERARNVAEAEAHTEVAKAKSGVALPTSAGGVQQTKTGPRTEPFTRAELDALMEDRVPMVTPVGDGIMIPRIWVEEVGKQPGQLFTVEDVEMIGGEITSEIVGATASPAALTLYYGDKDDWTIGGVVQKVTDFMKGGNNVETKQPRLSIKEGGGVAPKKTTPPRITTPESVREYIPYITGPTTRSGYPQ